MRKLRPGVSYAIVVGVVGVVVAVTGLIGGDDHDVLFGLILLLSAQISAGGK